MRDEKPFQVESEQRCFHSERWLNGSCAFFVNEKESHAIGSVVVVILPGKTYLISDSLMGALVCDIPHQVLHNDKLFERASLYALIRIH